MQSVSLKQNGLVSEKTLPSHKAAFIPKNHPNGFFNAGVRLETHVHADPQNIDI